MWAHYKNVLFEEIQKNVPTPHTFHVLQIARSELSRKGMESEKMEYKYNYTLLFDDYHEHVPKKDEIRAVLKFIRQFRPDVLNVTGYASSVSTLPAILLAKVMGIKVIMSNESTQVDKSRNAWLEAIKRWAVQTCSGYITFGKTSADYLIHLGAKASRILLDKAAVVDNKQIEAIFHQEKSHPQLSTFPKSKNFIYVGRLAKEKRVDLLVKAFMQISSEIPDWGLIILGDGPEKQKIVEEMGHKNACISFFSSVGWKEVPKYFAHADCLVLPSDSEPWGLVVNEAMVCGLAVVVTDKCGCAPDLVKGNGYIIGNNNVEELSKALRNIAHCDNLERFKAQSKTIIEEFAVENVAQAYVKKVLELGA